AGHRQTPQDRYLPRMAARRGSKRRARAREALGSRVAPKELTLPSPDFEGKQDIDWNSKVPREQVPCDEGSADQGDPLTIGFCDPHRATAFLRPQGTRNCRGWASRRNEPS